MCFESSNPAWESAFRPSGWIFGREGKEWEREKVGKGRNKKKKKIFIWLKQ